MVSPLKSNAMRAGAFERDFEVGIAIVDLNVIL